MYCKIFLTAPQTTSYPFPKRFLHRERSSATSFKLQYPFFPLSSSRTCLHLLPRFLFSSLLPSIFPSIMRFRRQFLLKVWPVQLTFLLPILRRMFLYSLTLCRRFCIFHMIGSNGILHAYPAPHFKHFKVFLIRFVKCPIFSTISVCTTNIELR
jgi:hypothetical protein